MNALRESFEGKGYNEFLSENFFSGDSILYWKAHWAGYSYRIDTVVTTYVPLTPSLDENKIDIGKKEIKVQGFRKFIVFVESSRSTEYFIVTYISDNPDHSQKPFNFNSFTGTVLVNDLKFNKVSLLKYKGGKISRKGDKGANGEIMATACTTSQVCSWGGSCDSGLTITYTSGNVEGGGCSYPSGVSGCGNNTEWYLSYSYFDTDCSSGTYNPGVPSGGGEGPGGSSGGDPGGPSNPGDGEMTPAPETFTPAEVPELDPEDLNCNQLSNFHNDPTRDLNDFVNQNFGLTRDQIISQRGDLSITLWHSQPGGPNIRYITDPLVPSAVIDLRHMLVIGYYGAVVGNSVEMLQWVALNESGMDHQDYYSNQLGYDFYNQYGTDIKHNPSGFLDYLITFLYSGNRSALNNPSRVKSRCP